ncbi:MAG: hypothetical protein ACXADY_05100 [Candidatus Hodarchaeales archaeon]|jgi:hypothetical protein
MGKKDRPLGITIISILIMISGLLWIIAGTGWVLAAVISGELAIIILFTGLLIFLEGLGLWKLNIIAYIIAIISLGLNVLGILLSYKYFLSLIISDLLFALINPIITILLFIYFIKVRSHF